jgi:hypothetical protein
MSYYDDDYDPIKHSELNSRIEATVTEFVKEHYSGEALAKMVEEIHVDVERKVAWSITKKITPLIETMVENIATPHVETVVKNALPKVVEIVTATIPDLAVSIPKQIAGRLISRMIKAAKDEA